MLRSVGRLRILNRQLSTTPSSFSFFKNLQDEFKKEAAKQQLEKDVKEVKVDLDKLSHDIAEGAKDYAESDKFKKIMKETETTTEKLGEAAKKVKDSVGIDTDKIGDTIKQTFENIKNMEFTQTPQDRMEVFKDDYISPNYNPPKELRMRNIADKAMRDVKFDADEESQGMALHKDFVLYQKIKNSKVGKTVDEYTSRMKASDNLLLRSFTTLGSTVGSKLSKLSSSEFNDCMKSIKALDRNFTPDNFITFLKSEMIPIILEAGALNDQEVVDDWCLDTAAQKILLSHNVAAKDKLKYYERTINLTRVDVAGATLTDGLPVLKITFETDRTMAFTDESGNIVESEGSPQPDEIYKVYHTWIMTRDPMEPEPAAAWRLSDCEDFAQKQLF